MVPAIKKRKLESNSKIDENAGSNSEQQNLCESKRKTLCHNSQEASTSTKTKIDVLQDEINHVRYLKNQFKEENKKLEFKLMEKEADVMDKLSNNIKLEQVCFILPCV